jgi:hypothetical protein
MSAGSNRKAVEVQKQSEAANLAENQRQFNLVNQQNQPFMKAGYASTNALSALNGLPQYNNDNGTQTSGADPMQGFQGSAWYQNMNDPRIMQETNAAYGAKGMGLDGSAMKAMAQGLYNNRSNALSNYANSLSGQATSGQNAVNNVGQLGAQYTGMNNATRTNTANALASSYQQRANNVAGMQNGAYNWLAQAGMKMVGL